jgi:hypothetical protein
LLRLRLTTDIGKKSQLGLEDRDLDLWDLWLGTDIGKKESELWRLEEMKGGD